ncbi:MAG: DUF4214 domain-containing protein, partial [Cellulomonadaceae bacterium]|nr:DUF4214 domain-containing protein [Cellulomonadaceae bacterium]
SGHLRQEDLRGQLIASDEYFDDAGGTSTAYVAQLYRDILGREGSAPDVAYWAGTIASVGRGPAAMGVWFSLESARLRVGETYAVHLDRAPDPAGLTSWPPYWIAHGETLLREGIVSSQEYLDRAHRLYG